MKSTHFLLITMMALTLAACQNSSETKPDQNPAAAPKAVDYGTPYSNGPTTAPDIKGPSSPPPQEIKAPAAQAVTTNENIRLTLPLKTQ